MFSTIIENKRFIDDELQLSDVNYVNNNVDIINTLEVKQRHLFRWDRISYEAYQNEEYGDLLYKFNEYTHPYEVKVGDIILIPNLNQLQQNVVIDDYDNDWIEFNIKTHTRKKETKRLDYLQRKGKTPTANTFKPVKNNIDDSIIVAQ